jgi:hypothetical protein
MADKESIKAQIAQLDKEEADLLNSTYKSPSLSEALSTWNEPRRDQMKNKKPEEMASEIARGSMERRRQHEWTKRAEARKAHEEPFFSGANLKRYAKLVPRTLATAIPYGADMPFMLSNIALNAVSPVEVPMKGGWGAAAEEAYDLNTMGTPLYAHPVTPGLKRADAVSGSFSIKNKAGNTVKQNVKASRPKLSHALGAEASHEIMEANPNNTGWAALAGVAGGVIPSPKTIRAGVKDMMHKARLATSGSQAVQEAYAKKLSEQGHNDLNINTHEHAGKPLTQSATKYSERFNKSVNSKKQKIDETINAHDEAQYQKALQDWSSGNQPLKDAYNELMEKSKGKTFTPEDAHHLQALDEHILGERLVGHVDEAKKKHNEKTEARWIDLTTQRKNLETNDIDISPIIENAAEKANKFVFQTETLRRVMQDADVKNALELLGVSPSATLGEKVAALNWPEKNSASWDVAQNIKGHADSKIGSKQFGQISQPEETALKTQRFQITESEMKMLDRQNPELAKEIQKARDDLSRFHTFDKPAYNTVTKERNFPVKAYHAAISDLKEGGYKFEKIVETVPLDQRHLLGDAILMELGRDSKGLYNPDMAVSKYRGLPKRTRELLDGIFTPDSKTKLEFHAENPDIIKKLSENPETKGEPERKSTGYKPQDQVEALDKMQNAFNARRKFVSNAANKSDAPAQVFKETMRDYLSGGKNHKTLNMFSNPTQKQSFFLATMLDMGQKDGKFNIAEFKNNLKKHQPEIVTDLFVNAPDDVRKRLFQKLNELDEFNKAASSPSAGKAVFSMLDYKLLKPYAEKMLTSPQNLNKLEEAIKIDRNAPKTTIGQKAKSASKKVSNAAIEGVAHSSMHRDKSKSDLKKEKIKADIEELDRQEQELLSQMQQ